MASTFAAAGEESNHTVSPRTIKRTLSSNSSCGHGHQAGSAAPKCVCAPATHARSFKCRLHRVNSQSHSHQSPPLPSQPVASAPSNRTVEAQ